MAHIIKKYAKAFMSFKMFIKKLWLMQFDSDIKTKVKT